MRKPTLLAALTTLSLTPSLTLAHPSKPPSYDTKNAKAEAVKEAFTFAWEGYYKHALPNDELHPIDNGFGNSRNGWGASAADALSTALIMELPEVVEQILDHIGGVDYSSTVSEVSLFETTIRYLGGMLSGYDLLKGPFKKLASDDKKVEKLLTQSVNLAENMAFAFDTKSGVPHNNLNFHNKTTDGSEINGIATVGTLILEWTRLSDLSGDKKFAKMVEKAQSYLIKPKPEDGEPLPGLLRQYINIETGLIEKGNVSWGAEHDSFYEYLIKMYVYDPKRFESYKERWLAAADSSIEHLKSSPKSHPDMVFLAKWEDGTLVKESEHLTCFNGGNFILGGQVLDRPDLVEFGLKLVNGCYQTYHNTATQIGPDSFGWDEDSVPDSEKEFFEENGYYPTNPFYNLRPEVIESYYYAFQATGESKYQDWAWEAFVAINATARAGSGFSAISDVNDPDGGNTANNQESFLFAEVMKYSYMIQNPDGEWNVAPDGKNKWVYNTEAHPVKVFEG